MPGAPRANPASPGEIQPDLSHLFFTTGPMVSLAGASAAQIFPISMAGMAATTSSLAQFAFGGLYLFAGS
jgi:hypothetical protein